MSAQKRNEDRTEELSATSALMPVAVKVDKPVEYFKLIGALVGNLSGVIALATIIYGGGALVQNGQALNERVTGLERNGSSGLQSHEKLDDYRDVVLKEQIAEYRTDVRDLKVLVQTLNEEFAKTHQTSKP